MLIIGVDFHSRFQQIAMVDTETGEVVECRVDHSNGEAQKFYAELQKPVRVGMEAIGYTQWFERLLAKVGILLLHLHAIGPEETFPTVQGTNSAAGNTAQRSRCGIAPFRGSRTRSSPCGEGIRPVR
jgi:hypothetical protein